MIDACSEDKLLAGSAKAASSRVMLPDESCCVPFVSLRRRLSEPRANEKGVSSSLTSERLPLENELLVSSIALRAGLNELEENEKAFLCSPRSERRPFDTRLLAKSVKVASD